METLEERVSSLEREMTAMRLEWLATQDKTEKRFSSIERDTKRDIGDIHQYLTILLGLATVQHEDTQTIKEDVSVLKDDVKNIKEDVVGIEVHLNRQDQRLDRLETKFDEHTALLTQILARLS